MSIKKRPDTPTAQEGGLTSDVSINLVSSPYEGEAGRGVLPWHHDPALIYLPHEHRLYIMQVLYVMGKAQKPIKLTLYCSGFGIRIRMAKIINMILAILFFSSIPITPFTGYTMCLSSWGQALHLFLS